MTDTKSSQKIDSAIAELSADLGEAPASPQPAAENNQPEKISDDHPTRLLADLRNAERFVCDWRDVLRFRVDNAESGSGTWMKWTGKVWQFAGGNERECAKSTAKRMADEYMAAAIDLRKQADDLRAALPNANPEGKADIRQDIERLTKQAQRESAAAEKISAISRIEAMILLAKSDPHIAITPDRFDADAHLLNTPSGIVDLTTGRIMPHDRERYCSKITMAAPSHTHDLGQWRIVFDNLFQGDSDLEQYVQHVLAAALLGDNRFEQLFMFVGPGRSGKGTLLAALKSAAGSYANAADFATFTRKDGGKGPRDDLYRIRDSRLVLCAEANAGEAWDLAVIKALTGNDDVATRALYGTHAEYVSRATLLFQVNPGQAPAIPEHDDAFWARMVAIPCGPTVPESKRDPALKTWSRDPATGGAALLRWVIDGAVRIHQQKLKRLDQPKSVTDATLIYRGDNDRIADWLTECCRVCDPARAQEWARTRVTSRDLANSYKEWCEHHCLPDRVRLSDRARTLVLRSLGCKNNRTERIGGKKVKVWTGISLDPILPPEDNAAHDLPDIFFPSAEASHSYLLASLPGYAQIQIGDKTRFPGSQVPGAQAVEPGNLEPHGLESPRMRAGARAAIIPGGHEDSPTRELSKTQVPGSQVPFEVDENKHQQGTEEIPGI